LFCFWVLGFGFGFGLGFGLVFVAVSAGLWVCGVFGFWGSSPTSSRSSQVLACTKLGLQHNIRYQYST
jgi:hypothetical protein